MKNFFFTFGEKAQYDIIINGYPFYRYDDAPILTLPPIQDLVTTILALQNDKELTQRVIDRFQNSASKSEQKLAEMLIQWSKKKS